MNSSQDLRSIIPTFYSKILDARLLSLNVTETKATCGNCLRSRDGRFAYKYKPHLKCCTFYPFLPNFAVGGILRDELRGASTLRKKIRGREFTLPLGAFPTLGYQHAFYHKDQQDFGTREDLLCPYYDLDEKNCGVWDFRGVVCTTFFCTSDRGPVGQARWAALSDYLSYVEMALAEECLVQLDFSPRDISDQLDFLNRKEWTERESTQTALGASEFKKFWNGYENFEEFFLKCYELVRNITRKEFTGIAGEQGKVLLDRIVTNELRT